jgi:hypothetical protein
MSSSISINAKYTYQMASFIYKIINPSPKENSRLDPLTTLIKLAILPYKSEGTKLSIDSNYIHYSENTIYQFAVRKYFGDSYNDLRDLNKTLHKAVAWYYDDPKLRYLFESAVIGLEKLKKTYGNTGKADAVQSYIDILSGFNRRVMNEIDKEKNKIKNRKDREKNSDRDRDKDRDKEKTNDESINQNNMTNEEHELKLHDILKTVWTEDDKEIVLRFFQKMKSTNNEEDIRDDIDGLEALLISIHKKIEKEVKILSSI